MSWSYISSHPRRLRGIAGTLYTTFLMMKTKMVLETSVSFIHLMRLIAREDFIEHFTLTSPVNKNFSASLVSCSIRRHFSLILTFNPISQFHFNDLIFSFLLFLRAFFSYQWIFLSFHFKPWRNELTRQCLVRYVLHEGLWLEEEMGVKQKATWGNCERGCRPALPLLIAVVCNANVWARALFVFTHTKATVCSVQSETSCLPQNVEFCAPDGQQSTAKLKAISCPTTRHGGAWGERRYSSYSFYTSALGGGEWLASRPL
jgi:hypothetical protein